MTKQDWETARELKKRLAKVVALADLKVFGSRARENSDDDSDLDVFVEVEQLDRQIKKAIRDVVWEVGFERSIYISPLIFTREEVERTPLRSSAIVRNIAAEGITI